MILYAAYTKGTLLDQVTAESEDTALAKLKLDYPKLDEVTFEIIDPDYSDVEEELESTPEVITYKKKDTEESNKPFKVIQADKIEITVNIVEGSIAKEDLEELEEAAEKGLVIAKAKE